MKSRGLIAGGARAVAALTGCGSSSHSAAPATSSTTTTETTTTTKKNAPLVAKDLRAKRYCEVPLIRVNNGNGGIEMVRRASRSVGPLAEAAKHYTLHNVDRRTDPDLDEAGLATLGPRLHPPTGWNYSTRQLTKPLRVVTTSAGAKVFQDDFGNSYSLETGG